MIKRLALIVFSLPSLFDSSAAAENWPQFRGPDRNGASKETGLLKSWPVGGPKLLWVFRDGGVGYSGVSIVGDRLYSLGGRGEREYLYAIDQNTQKQVWSVDVGRLHRHASGDGPCSTPTVDGEFVYAVGGHGRMVCVKAADGTVIWTKDVVEKLQGDSTQYGFPESPLVDKDQVVITPGGRQGAIAAFDIRTGELKWRCAECVDGACCTSMIAVDVGNVRQYVQATNGNLVGVRALDGQLLWHYQLDRGNAQASFAIIFKNDCIFILEDGGGKLLKLRRAGDRFEVEEIYRRTKFPSGGFGSTTLTGEHLYSDQSCQNFNTGKKIWAKRSREGAGVTFADGRLYCCCYVTGTVQLIEATPAGFRQHGNFRLPEKSRLREAARATGIYVHPALANGKLYLRDQELIFCYDVRTP